MSNDTIHSDMFEGLMQTIQEGDKFNTLVFKAGGFPARKGYTDWLNNAVVQLLQTQLVYETHIKQLQQELANGRSLKTEETPAGTSEGKTGITQPNPAKEGN